MGGGDAASNPRLRLAIDRARTWNMPRDTIDRAVQRGAGGGEGAHYQQVTYEGYGPGGAAVLISSMTDNRNRTVAEIRNVLARHGGNLGADGSVAYLFNEVGHLGFPHGTSEEALIEAALGAGAEDVLSDADGSLEVLTDPADFLPVRDALAQRGLVPRTAEITMRPATSVPLGARDGENMLKLLEALEDLDDVQEVYTNAGIPADVLARA
jgi:YebC/PmpR family DNA-binding regulatory protein